MQDYPIRGSVAVTASGTASWLDFLLPLTASTLHVRLLNLEDSDDFQYQVFSQDDSGSQQGLTQLYRVGDTLYLRTDVLPDVLPATDPTDPTTHIVKPELGSYAANLYGSNTLFTMSLYDRLGETRYSDALKSQKKSGNVWIRMQGGTVIKAIKASI